VRSAVRRERDNVDDRQEVEQLAVMTANFLLERQASEVGGSNSELAPRPRSAGSGPFWWEDDEPPADDGGSS
jgi:hypothetical protein